MGIIVTPINAVQYQVLGYAKINQGTQSIGQYQGTVLFYYQSCKTVNLIIWGSVVDAAVWFLHLFVG